MDNPANTILRKIHGAMMGLRTIAEASTWRPGRILVHTEAGHTIEITARQLRRTTRTR